MYTEIKNVPPGYPSVAALVSKDNDFAIFRKFRYLNARNLLYLQAELVDLENELETFDRSLQVKDDIGELKSWKKFAADEDRWNLVLRIRKTLDEYSKEMSPHGSFYKCSPRCQIERYCNLAKWQIYKAQAKLPSKTSMAGLRTGSTSAIAPRTFWRALFLEELALCG